MTPLLKLEQYSPGFRTKNFVASPPKLFATIVEHVSEGTDVYLAVQRGTSGGEELLEFLRIMQTCRGPTCSDK